MTRQRMDDVLEALRSYGWYLLGEPEHPNASPDPFALEQDNSVTWVISRADNPAVVELEFHVFEHPGHQTSGLRDIMYCQVVGRDERLYFAKRHSQEWRRDLVTFVQRVGLGRPDERATPPGGERR